MISNSGSFGFPAPVIIITAILIPVLSGAVQYISIRLSQSLSGQQMDKDNPMASTMRTMNVTMPLFSVFIAFSFSAGIGSLLDRQRGSKMYPADRDQQASERDLC